MTMLQSDDSARMAEGIVSQTDPKYEQMLATWFNLTGHIRGWLKRALNEHTNKHRGYIDLAGSSGEKTPYAGLR